MLYNARTIRKILMSDPFASFWNLITVRLPSSVIKSPKPHPELPEELGTPLSRDLWKKTLPDGTVKWVCFANPRSRNHPSVFTSDNFMESVFFIEKVEDHFEWWEGNWNIQDSYRKDLSKGTCSFDLVAAHRARCIWEDTFLNGLGSVDEVGAALHTFFQARDSANSHQASISEDGRFVFYTFYVTGYCAKTKLKFCRALCKGLRALQAEGFEPKIVRDFKRESEH